MSTQPNSITKEKSTPSKKEIIRMMEDFDSGKNVTVKEFCEMHEISAATFREWHYIYENRDQHNGQSGGFVSLDVMGPGEGPSNPSLLFAEVQGIRLYREVPPSYLKALLS